MREASKVIIPVDAATKVSGLLLAPVHARACFVMAHGAGAGMTHPFLRSVAEGLARRDVATLRYQFLYMERGTRRPDPPDLAQSVVRAVSAAAAEHLPALPLIAGGKSFGGRMTSHAQAASPIAEIRGLAFLGFPLHPAGRPSDERASHLFNVKVPMLFLQGARDTLADLQLLRPVIRRLGALATLRVFDDADHSFHVPARTGRKDSEVLELILDAFSAWIDGTVARGV